jgi:3-phenylpropionate/trans-cinnamate dioxygenase ferredoxin reductase component
MSRGTIIVGAGQAGFQVAASLRAGGYQEPIALIGDEPHIPYQRPPLSKGFLVGKESAESIELRPVSFYRDHAIDLLTGEVAKAIDRASRQVRLASARALPYEKLVLATGARNRLLTLPGAELDGVLYLRSLTEASALKERIELARQIVVIGGGFIGLEVAAVASALGKQVTVLEMLPRLMSRAVAPVISEFYSQLHAAKGVRVNCGVAVSEILGSHGKAQAVKLSNGTQHAAGLVIVGVGVSPNLEIARDAGLTVANGIAVDERLRTSDKDIYAVGDCAEHPNRFAGSRVRLESVQNAADQAQCAAEGILGRQNRSYAAVPWFWTDQFDIKLQMAGISAGHDRAVTRGSAENRKLSVFYFKEKRLIAIDSINRPLDHILGRKLLAAGTTITPDQAADESFDLKQLTQVVPRNS